ncbi:hypothetical protein EVAR_68993_1 [Eumeta japonica]|uniref:Uncharacterized protein n=1 Tax=Eumeta variegata TaxID=151549 RepID=A0A4C2A4P1_EUMVA|nr:hypothetical protein EVAR_68993_1 [Eumeta japonica]
MHRKSAQPGPRRRVVFTEGLSPPALIDGWTPGPESTFVRGGVIEWPATMQARRFYSITSDSTDCPNRDAVISNRRVDECRTCARIDAAVERDEVTWNIEIARGTSSAVRSV